MAFQASRLGSHLRLMVHSLVKTTLRHWSTLQPACSAANASRTSRRLGGRARRGLLVKQLRPASRSRSRMVFSLQPRPAADVVSLHPSLGALHRTAPTNTLCGTAIWVAKADFQEKPLAQMMQYPQHPPEQRMTVDHSAA